MKFKGTAALFALLVLLGAWVYFTDIRGAEERERTAEEAGLAFPVDSETIRRLRLTYSDRVIEARRAEESWEFVSPPGLEADSREWDLLASNVPRIEREETVISEPGDAEIASFGLDVPSLAVEVELADGALEAILFGGENPAGTHYYAKLGTAPAVFLAPRSWISTLSKDVDDLRDKSILRFNRDAIDGIEITGSVRLSLNRDGEDWFLDEPLDSAAARAEIDGFLGDLAAARATGFGDLSDEALTGSAAGLDRPRLRIALRDSVAGEDHVLIIGRSPENQAESYYARDVSRDTVFVIDGNVVENAEQPIFNWRDKTIAEFERASISAVRIERENGSVVLRMGDSGWELADQGPARLEAVSLMFNAIEFEPVSDIIDSPGSLATYGLDTPRLRIVFEADGAPVLAFGFGDQTSDGESLYWKSEAEDRVKTVSANVFDRFDVTAEDLIDSDSFEDDP